MKDEEDGRGEGVKARERCEFGNASERAGGAGCCGTHRSARVVRVWERIGVRRWCGFGNASEHADNAEPDKAPETSSVGMSKDEQQCDEAQ